MRIPWPGQKCIVCLNSGPLTWEHIIPRALGGDLICNFLCKPCNDRFGFGIDAKAKFDPGLRLTANRLQNDIPTVHAAIEGGQRYVVKSGPARATGVWQQGAILGSIERQDDGSLMVPDNLVRRKLREMLAAEGHEETFIAEALEKQARAPVGERVELSDEISIVNWEAHCEGADMSDNRLASDLLFAKIAYEFSGPADGHCYLCGRAALISGSARFETAITIARIQCRTSNGW